MSQQLKLDANVFVERHLSSPEYDGVVLVLYPEQLRVQLPKHVDSFVDGVAQLDEGVRCEPTLCKCEYVSGQRLIVSPTGPITGYDDARVLYNAARSGVKRALKAGVRRPLLIVQQVLGFSESQLVLILGALEALSVPLQLREDVPEKASKFQRLGIYSEDTQDFAKIVQNAVALETARIVARDIAGGDPERMSAKRVVEYVKAVFEHDPNVTLKILEDPKEIANEYPLLAAVNRAAGATERHAARVVEIEYRPNNESRVSETLMLVGKGITYDTGGADVKISGAMAGMSRDKSGAAAVAGFLKACALLKPPHLKVVGVLCLARNAVGEESYVADELLIARSGKRVRVGNTDAEGRLAMADAVYHMSVRALNELNPHIYTIATLTGHARRSYGPYTAAMDNECANGAKHSRVLEVSGNKMADPVEVSSLKPEDFEANRGLMEGDDVTQFDNTHRIGKDCRGHQIGAAFLVMAGGLEDKKVKYTHLDIAGRAGDLPNEPTAAPLLALSHMHKILL